MATTDFGGKFELAFGVLHNILEYGDVLELISPW